MKRPIKFRFWCKPAKGFVQNYNYNGAVDDLFSGEDPTLEASQYTGVNDSENKEIYEGDVLEITSNEGFGKKYTGVVEYQDGAFGCRIQSPEGTLSIFWLHQPKFYNYNLKILGNEYELEGCLKQD
jgi:uncharacterized phage protein (TIGR01671 family)